MPGSIRVSVLEAFDLPEAIGDGEDVVIKVAVGAREFQTEPNKASGGKTTPWGLDFVFPVLNLRDSLLVMLLTENGEIISKNEIDTPSIVEKGSFEVNLFLNGGGYIHLSLSFVLTDEERRRIDIMRAAALKRREQEALKTANTQSLENEGDSTPSDPHSAAAGDHEKDTKEFGVVNVSPTTATQEGEEPQLNKSERILQGTHEETSVGLEPMGNSDPTAHESVEKSSIGKSDESTSPQDSVETGQSAAERINLDSSCTNEIPSQVCTSSKLEEQTASENNGESLEEPVEVNNVNPSPNSVKAKIKAFETTRPKVVIKQGHILPANIDVHVSNSKLKSSPTTNMENEAEQLVLSDDKDVTGTKDEMLDPENRMQTVKSSKSFPECNVAALMPSEEDLYQRKKECLHEREGKEPEGNLEPVTNMDYVECDESNVGTDKTLVSASKRRRRNIDLMGVSKQVLTGAVIGAVSGALLIAAGAFLWAPNKRINTRVRQRRTQEKRK